MLSVLIYDRDPQFARAVQQKLTDRGFRVSPASSPQAAEAAIARDKPDIILADRESSGEQGRDLLRDLSRHGGRVSVIMMDSSAEHAAEAILGGADDYVVKQDTVCVAEAVARLTEDFPAVHAHHPRRLALRFHSGLGVFSKRSALYVRGLRFWTDLPQEEFAAVLGYQSRSVSKWEQGAPIARHARAKLALLDNLRKHLITALGWRGSQQWLRSPQQSLHDRAPLDCLKIGETFQVMSAADSAVRSRPSATPPGKHAPVPDETRMLAQEMDDLNYAAYLREVDELEKEYHGGLVAYADGKRVAVGKDPDDLLRKLPPESREAGLFIKDIPERIIRFRRPMRIPRV